MAKQQYKRIRVLMESAQIPDADQMPDDPTILWAAIVAKFPGTQFKPHENGRALFGGVLLNHAKVAGGVLRSLESRGTISDETIRAGLEVVTRRELEREHRRSSTRVEKFARMSWISGSVIGNAAANVFYASPEWRRVRYAVLEKLGNRCMACGRGPKNGVCIHVDHIKPRSIRPDLALDIANLQVLCDDCNIGKSNYFDTAWSERGADHE